MRPCDNLGDVFGRGRSGDETLTELQLDGSRRSFRFAELDGLADAVARGLAGCGYRRGERVAVASANRAEYVAVLLGALRAGLAVVPLNVKLPRAQIQHILADSGAVVAFADSDHCELLPADIDTVRFDAATGGFRQLIDRGSFDAVEPDPDELALVLYTSGSSGVPKGVMLSHGGLGWALRARLDGGAGELVGRATVVASPLYHMNGLVGVLMQCAAPASFVLMPRFAARPYLQAIADYRCGRLTCVASMLAIAAKEADLIPALDLSSVEQVTLGSAPSTTELVETVAAMFPRARVSLGYGATETGPIVFGRHPERKPVPPMSLGYPYPGVEVKLIDGQAPDEGNLCLRSPGVALGYLNLPRQTAARFREGWYVTGDLMRRDADGFFYFRGRADEMFVCGGENVYPSEVEATLVSHPLVETAIVVPLASETKGQVPVAFVVPTTGGVGVTSESELQAFARERGPLYQYPRHVAFLAELPLVAGTAKTDRRLLEREAERAWGAPADAGAGHFSRSETEAATREEIVER